MKNQLFLTIENGEKIFLPKKYHKINNLCAIIYDQLTEIYKDLNYEDLKKTDIKFKGNERLLNELRAGYINALDWLKLNEMNSEIEVVLTKQILLSIVSDFINFMFESMHCAKRGKVIVAYALLRKPLTDELLILEQLLGNRTEFINKFFHSGNPDDYDPSNKNIDKKTIIEQAIKKLRIGIFTSSDFIYDLRYNKSFEAGINGISNHALHIVTKDKNYKTSNQSLNFVFDQKEKFDRYYKHYYELVPYLLLYSVSIIDELVFDLLPDENNQNLKTVKEFRRLIGLILTLEYSGYSKKKSKVMFDKMLENLIITCPNCGRKNQIERADCELFFETEVLLCTNCFEQLLSNDDSIKIIESSFQQD